MERERVLRDIPYFLPKHKKEDEKRFLLRKQGKEVTRIGERPLVLS